MDSVENMKLNLKVKVTMNNRTDDQSTADDLFKIGTSMQDSGI